MTTLVKAITAKNCGDITFTPREVPDEKTGNLVSTQFCDKKYLMLVAGILRSVEEVKRKVQQDSKDGKEIEQISFKFVGDFTAQNMDTEEIFISSECFLPKLAADFLMNQFTSYMFTAPEVAELEFAFKIGVKDNRRSPTKYEYTIEPLAGSEPVKSRSQNLLELIKCGQSTIGKIENENENEKIIQKTKSNKNAKPDQ